jgi:hypothetical protein
VERSDYVWDLGPNRPGPVRSRSPPVGPVQKRPHYDEAVTARELRPPEVYPRYEFSEYDKQRSASKRITDEFDDAGNRVLVQKSVDPEDGSDEGVYRLPEVPRSLSRYVEYSGKLTPPHVNLGLGSRFKDEKLQHHDPLVSKKIAEIDTYENTEKHVFRPRDALYSKASASIGVSHQSSGNPRANFSGIPLNEQPRSSGKSQETLSLSEYRQRFEPWHEAEPNELGLHRLDSRHEAELTDRQILHRRDTYSPTGPDRRDYKYARIEERERDDYGYPSSVMYRRMDLPDHEFNHKDMRRANIVDPTTEWVRDPEYSHRNPSGSNLREHHSYHEKKPVSNHIVLSRSSAASKEDQILYLDESHSHHHDISHYGLERDTGLVSRKERIMSPEFQYDAEKRFAKAHLEKAERLRIYGQSDRMAKRKYAMVEDTERHEPRAIPSSKWITSGRPHDRNPQFEEWVDEDASDLVLSRRVGYEPDISRREERTLDIHRGPPFRDGILYADPDEDRSNKPVSRNIKGHSKPVYLNWHNSHQSDKKHFIPKANNVWLRGKDDDRPGFEVEKSDPREDSEEFKQLVQKHFLTFSKKLNDNEMVQKRYKEDGKAGSLFCIVCGRSLSKEFMDTKRLVNHAHMSHKVGLRAQHLGLQKAICVLLGWSCVVPSDWLTWSPDIISAPEALAQKEDLMIWPPAILIHNTSFPDHHGPQPRSNNGTIEALEEFLRVKGLSRGKVRFGKPGDPSIMVVKFLGTFSGLQDAEKLHSYFVDNKRGRKEFENIGSSKSKSKEGGKIEGDKFDEALLYGYMGIAEDLNKVDFDTKRKCSIKSKKEIRDLADAPVKPE